MRVTCVTSKLASFEGGLYNVSTPNLPTSEEV